MSNAMRARALGLVGPILPTIVALIGGADSSRSPGGVLRDRARRTTVLTFGDLTRAYDMPLVPGSAFGSYRIIEPLGRGGMATVLKAYEAALDRHVALKVLPAEFMHDPGFAERFSREARVVAKLEHRHIVPIYNFGIEEGIPWMTMRLVPGGTVSSLLKRGRVSLPSALAILKESAEALDYAHRLGVLHRDVKPMNILVDREGHVYLADFGIAKMVEGSTLITTTGFVGGTPHYMAPEQARAENVDHRADIYALGIVAYSCHPLGSRR